MSDVQITHERISFQHQAGLPEVQLRFCACRAGSAGHTYDLVNFSEKAIDRWSVPHISSPKAVDLLRRWMPKEELPLGALSHEDHFRLHYMTPHTAQISCKGQIFVGLGDPYDGICIQVIDTKNHVLHLIPEDFAENLMLYASTGGFSPDGNKWLSVRWPFEDSLSIAKGKKELARCEVVGVHTDSLELETIYRFEGGDRPHQVACSPDGRYVVFAPFKWDQSVPYPSAAIHEDPEGYRRSHEAGITGQKLVTVDLEAGCHWETEIPVPVVGHPHFDALDPQVFYLSAHNICPTTHGMMIEGPAALYRMRLLDGETVIERQYSDERFFRISQHTLFIREGRTMIAVTNLPNHLDLLDGESMTLWRRVEVFSAPPLDFRATGNAICPPYPESCFSVSASRDGRHIVLVSSRDYRIYDVEEDRLLEVTVALHLPEGSRVVGHVRYPGE